MHGVHKVLIQFQNLFLKSILKISLPGWLYFDQYCLKLLFQIKLCVSDMIFMCFMNVLNKLLLNGYSSREGIMCILVYRNKTGRSDAARVQDYVWKRSTITFFSSSMAQEIYRDWVSVGCSEKFFIFKKFFILRKLLQQVICKLLSFWLVIWLKSL